VLTQAMEDITARSELYQPDRLYSFPAFYRENVARIDAMSTEEIRDRIAGLEVQWKIPSIATFIYFDRYFRLELNYTRAIRAALMFMEFVDVILHQEEPLWIRGNLTNFFGLVFQEACLARGIPSLKVRAACVSGRIEFMDETSNGGLRGWRPLYEHLLSDEKCVPGNLVDEALRWLRAFRERPNRPRYAIANSKLQFRFIPFAKRMLHSFFLRFDRRYWHRLFGHSLDREFHFREPLGRALLVEFIGYELRAIWQRQAKWFRRKVDLEEPFIYLPLQFAPEISTLTHGLRWEDQANLVSNLAKYLPSGLRLYVKEHTSMVGRRDNAFYRAIKQHYNVTLVSPSMSTFDLIRKSRAVATITSTAGWEAFVLGKPVLVFGRVFFQEFPNVLKLDIDDDTPRKVASYLDGFRPDEKAIERAVIAYFAATSPGETGDIGNDVSRAAAKDNAEAFAKACRRQIEQFPLSELWSMRAAARTGIAAE
jgi:hypothetical protein